MCVSGDRTCRSSSSPWGSRFRLSRSRSVTTAVGDRVVERKTVADSPPLSRGSSTLEPGAALRRDPRRAYLISRGRRSRRWLRPSSGDSVGHCSKSWTTGSGFSPLRRAGTPRSGCTCSHVRCSTAGGDGAGQTSAAPDRRVADRAPRGDTRASTSTTRSHCCPSSDPSLPSRLRPHRRACSRSAGYRSPTASRSSLLDALTPPTPPSRPTPRRWPGEHTIERPI